MDSKKFLQSMENLNIEGLTVTQLYNKISEAAMCCIVPTENEGRKANYLSIEFLIGRVFYNNLMEMGILDNAAEILMKKGVDINVFEEIEDAALGNGGLGRLAACFLDSAAAEGLPLYGYGIRYKYGLFKQVFENGEQIEYPDDWQKYGDPWSIRKDNEKQVISFSDMNVIAVPYDMPIIGKRINTLRLYQAEGGEEEEKISSVLYPSDDTNEGKLLRVRQEYFLSAAAIGDLMRNYELNHGNDYSCFVKENCIQLNDTHPVMAIPELIRVLMQKGVSYRLAAKIATETFNYTNHTILPEALECWDAKLIRSILPEIANILEALAETQRYLHKKENYSLQEMAETSIYNNTKHSFSMANTALFISGKINGVAKLHSEIIKHSLFSAEYAHHSEKFTNITNGIAQRRWVMLANPDLSRLIDGYLSYEWRKDFDKLSGLNDYVNDKNFISDFMAVKDKNKAKLSEYVYKKENIKLLPNAIVYAQVKRLHEYKRQLMTALAIVEIYNKLKNGEIKQFTPSVFLFGGKSAPSYFRAKGIIKFINEIAKKINSDKEVNEKLQVIFIQNYNVSYAEKIVAGADVSLQISTAGLEASGTGNMKFMMNGAVTCGTMDGANIEIAERAGIENNYIFGARVEEIDALRKGNYDPKQIIKNNKCNELALNSLIDGTFSDGDKGYFKELYFAITEGTSWHKPDQYFILRDLSDYVQTLLRINNDYIARNKFVFKQIKNIANSAYFSSDRTIGEYAKEIWKIEK